MEKISGLGSIYYHTSKQRWVAQYTEDKNGKKDRPNTTESTNNNK